MNKILQYMDDSPKVIGKLHSSHSDLTTAHIDLTSNDDYILGIAGNSLQCLVKHIIEGNNDVFLNGDVNIIEYMISKYTGIEVNQLKDIEKLSLRVNKEFDLFNQFGLYLPKLMELSVNNSVTSSIQDVGSTFANLKVLRITNSRVKDLFGKIFWLNIGIISFRNLEILDLSFNIISDLFELEMCDKIEILNLRNNLISDRENLSYLMNISTLKSLNLNENPIKILDNYYDLISEKLPNLEKLDINDETDINSKSIKDDSFDAGYKPTSESKKSQIKLGLTSKPELKNNFSKTSKSGDIRFFSPNDRYTCLNCMDQNYLIQGDKSSTKCRNCGTDSKCVINDKDKSIKSDLVEEIFNIETENDINQDLKKTKSNIVEDNIIKGVEEKDKILKRSDTVYNV